MALSGTISGAYRGYTLQTTWTSTQNIAGNYSDITATHKLICDSTFALYIDGRSNTCTADGTAKSFTSPAISTGGGQTITLGTTTHRVYHNSNGSKSFTMTTVFNMQATIVSTYVDKITATGTITLNSIPRQATITGANNFNDEQNPYFTFSNAGGFAMTAELTFAGKTISRTGLGNATSGNYTFVLTDAERTTLRNATPNSNTMTVTYTLKTTISGTVYSSSLAKTMTIINGNPTAPTLTYQDTNTTTTAITGNNQRIIRNKSTLRAIIGTATAKKGASISSYSTTINGVTKAGNGNQDFGVINVASNINLVCTVTDSRGNKSSITKSVIIDDWISPTATITLYRVNNYETESKLKVDAKFSSLNGKNAITCRYRVKNYTGTTWTDWSTIANNTLGTLSLNNENDYNVEVSVNDKLSGYVTYSLILPKGKPIFFIDTGKNSLGVNRFPNTAKAVEMDAELYVNGGVGVTGNLSIDKNFYCKGSLQVNGVDIVSRGSNSNGNWVKFYDGTMICWKYEEVTDVAINNAYGSIYQTTRNITYPVAFVETPVLSCDMFRWGTSASWGTTSNHDTPKTHGQLRGMDFFSRATGTTTRIAWHAIGKWK